MIEETGRNADNYETRLVIASDLAVEELMHQFNLGYDIAFAIHHDFKSVIAMKKHADDFFNTQMERR